MSDAFTFEGDEITNFTAQLPSAVVECAAYPRGTLLTLTVQVRVRSVRVEEDRKGALTRKHILALEGVNVRDVLTPEQRRVLIEQAENLNEQPSAGDGFEPMLITDEETGPVVEDNDPAHAWMDEDDESSVHAVILTRDEYFDTHQNRVLSA